MIKYSSYVYKNGEWVKAPSLLEGSDYDSLSNQPVQNATGSSEEQYINIAGLQEGQYTLTGFFKFESSGDIKYTTTPLHLQIMKDLEEDYIYAIYSTIEHGTIYNNLIKYQGTSVISDTKFTTSGSDPIWGEI